MREAARQPSKAAPSLRNLPFVHSRGAVVLLVSYAVMFAVFLVAKLSYLQPSFADYWVDSSDYLRMARGPLSWIDFWAANRPFGVPLVYKLFGASIEPILTFQFWLGVVCWSALALAVAHTIRTPWLRPLGFLTVLAFSLSGEIIQWDLVIMTESITASLFVLLMALWLYGFSLYQEPGRQARKLAVFLLLASVTVFWSFTRDTHMYFVLALAGLLTLGLVLPAVRRHAHLWRYLTLIGVFVATFLVQNWTADIGMRHYYPLFNVIGKRILIDEERTAFFAAHGLPLDRTVTRYTGEFGHAYGTAIMRSDDMQHVRDWLGDHGKSTYMRYLAARPLESLGAPLEHENLQTILRPPNGYYGELAQLVPPQWMNELTVIMYPRPREAQNLVFYAGVLMLLALVLALVRLGRAAWLVPVVLLALIYPMMFLVWHGDSMEVGRHSFLIGVQLRLAIWLLLLFTLDAVVVGVRRILQRRMQWQNT